MDSSYNMRKLFILLVLCISLGNSAKILGIFPSPGYSQYILGESLLIALAGRGHNITVISVFETKHVKNMRNIWVEVGEFPEVILESKDTSIYENIINRNVLGLNISEKILSNTKVQNLIHSEETFDLVVLETFMDEALQVFANHFNAHQVLFNSVALNDWNSRLVGNPNIPSYMPNFYGGYSNHMAFSDRFRNTLALWFSRLYNQFIQDPAQQKLVDRYFPKKYNLNGIMYNASLILTCSHVSTTEALPLTNSVVEVGGLHIKEKQLPDKIREFLDSAKDGAILFSMGSNIKSTNLSRNLIREILVVIGKLKQKVLWKFEDIELEDKPDNLMISKWFPQNDILAHPNTILFISHGGLGSLTEAVYHGVAILGIPIFVDQFMNTRRVVSFGMGLELPLQKLSGKTLEDSIQEILNNPKYRDNAKRRSSIMNDRPMKPLDLAVYWVEYVLRQDGAHHLKSATLELSWYQLYLIDIIAALFAVMVAVSYSLFVVLRFLRRVVTAKIKTE